MKIADRMHTAHAMGVVLLCLTFSSCTSRRAQEACNFSDPPNEEFLRGRALHLELVDAETGEVAAYDTQGNPVLEGGQPLALWAEFDPPTSVQVCVLDVDDHPQVISAVTFSKEINTLPIGIYDLGAYQLLLSVDGTLVTTIDFSIR